MYFPSKMFLFQVLHIKLPSVLISNQVVGLIETMTKQQFQVAFPRNRDQVGKRRTEENNNWSSKSQSKLLSLRGWPGGWHYQRATCNVLEIDCLIDNQLSTSNRAGPFVSPSDPNNALFGLSRDYEKSLSCRTTVDLSFQRARSFEFFFFKISTSCSYVLAVW